MTKIVSMSRWAALMVAGVALSANAQGKSKGQDKGKGDDKVAVAVTRNDSKVAKGSSKNDAKVAVAVAKNDTKRARAINKADDKRDKAAMKAARKHVTAPQAVIVTREVLVANGYQIVRVTPSGTSQVIYYRRGNMGNGRGLGPVEKIIVVPAGDVVRFQSVPDPLLATILRRLGL